MGTPSFRDTEAFAEASETVLLCISNQRDRKLLAEHLSQEGLSIVSRDDDGSIPRFDLCLVDTATYPRIADELNRRRSEQSAVHLPVLLVLGPNESEPAARLSAEAVDDVVSVPTSGELLQSRIDSLLRTRRQSRQLVLFSRAMEDAISGITIARAGGDQELQYVNDAFVEITGYSREEALGRNCRFLQGPETAEEPVRKLRSAIDDEEPVSVELRNYRRDGTMFWNHVEIAPVYGEDGVTNYVGFQQDITDRVERNRTLRQYERIVQAAGDPIYALDYDLHITLANEATAELCGCRRSDVLGTHVVSVFGERHAGRLETAVLELLDATATEMTIESTVTDDDGRPRQYQTTVAELPAAESEGVVCVSRDITDDREREARLSVLDRVLRHNLRNKLLVMLGRVEFIENETDSEAILESTGVMENAAEELLDLAETAREFKQTIDPTTANTVGPVDIARVTASTVEKTRSEYGATRFVADLPDERWARAHDSIELAMTKLLELAAKAGDDVEVVVRMETNPDDETVTIRVSHDGEPIDPIERKALTAGSESDLQHTTGLGLWFVRWMAVNSGGAFEITGDEPGTAIEITLPLADPPAADA